jgi:hypothetical protein
LLLEVCPVKCLASSNLAVYVIAIDALYPTERVNAHGHRDFS